MRVALHRCPLPEPQRRARPLLCQECGARWTSTTRYFANRGMRTEWFRMPPQYHERNLADAYELETVAAVLPRWQGLRRWWMRQHARTLRRLWARSRG